MNTRTKNPARVFLSLALLAVAAIIFSACEDPEPADPAALIPGWQTYYDRDAGVEFKYPYNLKLDADTSADGQLVAELLWVGRETVVFKLETRDGGVPASVGVMVGGLEGTESTAEIDGEELRQIEVVRAGRTYVFTGRGITFDKVLDSVKFIE